MSATRGDYINMGGGGGDDNSGSRQRRGSRQQFERFESCKLSRYRRTHLCFTIIYIYACV